MSVYWLSFSTATPPRSFSQEELFELAGYSKYSPEIQRQFQVLFRASGVKRRGMWINEENPRPSTHPDEFHQRYMEGLRAIAPLAANRALDRAGLKGSDIDFVVFASCTGYSCPGFSVELAHLLGVREDRPTASFLGMGCSALVPSLDRASDYLLARPGSRALVVAAEICSATYWVDPDPETAMGNALFGDGAAAIILSSNKADCTRVAQPIEIQGFRTVRDSRFISEMGFTQKEGRLRLRLAREIPDRIVPLVLEMVRKLEVTGREKVMFHPGGRRVLDLITEAAPGWEAPIKWSREVLKNFGNMSSPTVAFVLEEALKNEPARSGDTGALITMGPGISVEGVRMRWM